MCDKLSCSFSILMILNSCLSSLFMSNATAIFAGLQLSFTCCVGWSNNMLSSFLIPVCSWQNTARNLWWYSSTVKSLKYSHCTQNQLQIHFASFIHHCLQPRYVTHIGHQTHDPPPLMCWEHRTTLLHFTQL